VNVQSAGLSLLRPDATVYAADQATVLGSASGAGLYNGANLSVTVAGVSPLQVFSVRVAGADSTAFGTGNYALTLNLGTGASLRIMMKRAPHMTKAQNWMMRLRVPRPEKYPLTLQPSANTAAPAAETVAAHATAAGAGAGAGTPARAGSAAVRNRRPARQRRGPARKPGGRAGR
jgi:hypothetical protein